MKVSIEFGSDTEKSEVLELFKHLLDKPSESLQAVEASLVRYLESTVKQAYSAASIKKFETENKDKIVAAADSLFKS